ncbi:hypothetical protein M8494_15675 [Serratia ureilytica]
MPRNKPSPPPFGLHNFCLLEQDDSALVYGLIGRFGRLNTVWSRSLTGRAFWPSFTRRRQTGAGLCREPSAGRPLPPGDETHLLPRRRSRRRFTHWYADSVVSGLIRRRMLRAIKQSAKKPAANHSPG